MKTIYIIGGTMGVGKTAACQLLKKRLQNSVFLDGDWCWDMSPFQVTDETKRMVVDNISHLLNNYIGCSAYENVIFCWIMHEQSIIDDILSRLKLDDCDVKIISLVCDEQTLKSHLEGDIAKGIRGSDSIEKSVERIAMYEKLDTIKIDVSGIALEKVVDKLLKL